MAAKKGKRKPKFRVGQVVAVASGTLRGRYYAIDHQDAGGPIQAGGFFWDESEVRPLTAREKGKP